MSHPEISLQPAEEADFEFYYTLKCEPDSIYWSGFSSAPDKKRLHQWFVQKLNNSDIPCSHTLYIISLTENGIRQKAGYLSVYPSENPEKCCEIGIGIIRAFRGRGIATEAIRLAEKACIKLGLQKIYAYIRSDNIASQAAFTRAGFDSTEKTKERRLENLIQSEKMLEYVYPPETGADIPEQ